MKLPKAKTYALEMVKGIRPGKIVTEPIGRLLRLHLDALEAHAQPYSSLGYRDLQTTLLPLRDRRQLDYQMATIVNLSITLTAIQNSPIA